MSLSGTDASKFAQAQFMGDVAALAPGQWRWNGWLSPKGRVIALFALLKQDEDALLLLLADAAPELFAGALARFVFRSRLRVVHETGLQLAGRFAAPGSASGAGFATRDDGARELDLGGEGGDRTLLVTQAPAPGDAVLAARWRDFDLAHGLPRLAPPQAEQWTPQQLSLDRLRAYSVKKGCYPGQEIVARTHFLGQAKRGLVRLRGEGPLAIADVFAAGDEARALGAVACVSGHEALAVLPLDAGDGPFLVEGVACKRLPLLDRLAR